MAGLRRTELQQRRRALGRARGAAGSGFSPFPFVYGAFSGTMQSDNVTMQFALQDPVQSAPGRGTYYRFELTIAFRACAPNSSTPVYFADDPEMDVMGGN